MKKSFLIYFAILLVAVLLLPSCVGNNNSGPTMHVTDPTMTTSTVVSPTEPTDEYTTETTTDSVQPTEGDMPTETQPSSDGKEKMLVSADPANPYINAVVERYAVSSDRLVAFYDSSMKSNGNLVYEFDGTVGSDGRPIRTKKTLKNIYTVSPAPELLAKKATGTAEDGNEYSEKETKLCQYFTEYVVFRFFAKEIQNA